MFEEVQDLYWSHHSGGGGQGFQGNFTRETYQSKA